MQQTDDVVSGWLSGADCVDGIESPAGPLYLEGEAATEAALTGSSASTNMFTSATTVSCGGFGGCDCC